VASISSSGWAMSLLPPATPYTEGFPGIRSFTIEYTYSYPSNGTKEQLRMYGYEPSTGTGYPVYLHGGGMGDKFTCETPEIRFAQEMASRGFVSAIMEMPSQNFATFACTGSDDSLINVSRNIFAYSGPGDRQPTALSTMCRRGTADCSAGIAVHGLSFGGVLSSIAPRFAPVTAMLRWSSGVFVPGGHSSCGVFSRNYTRCSHYALQNETEVQEYYAVKGGAEIRCAMDVEVSLFLPQERRRLINAHADPEYGDYHCTSHSDIGEFYAMPPLDHCLTHLDAPDACLNQARLSSGRDCGEDDNCIAMDGSGYYAVTRTQVGGFNASTMQGHNFHMHFDEGTMDNFGVPPQHTRGYFVNPLFAETEEAWGMRPGFDWLAATARRPMPSMWR